MSYTVNWITKVVSIPTSDLTLVGGTRYSLLMSDFLAEVRRLEWEPTEGLWAPDILEHTNTKVDFAGVDYAPFDDIINGYTVEFTGSATRVDLLGSNNNIVDILIPTGVTVVPSNSAGLIVKTIGSGLSTEQSDMLILIADILQGDVIPESARFRILHKLTKAILVDKVANEVNGLTQLTE